MKDYTCKEIGMLFGAGIGGAIAVAGFYISEKIMFFTFAVIGIAAGVYLGSLIDKRKAVSKMENESF